MGSRAVCGVYEIHPERVEAARAALPREAVLREAASLLKALSDPTRMRLLLALKEAGELCVCDLALLAGVSVSAVSHQLRLLRQARLVAFRKEGKQAYYRLADEHVAHLLRGALEHAEEIA
ncbi:MAG: metalloregulator ArsR/SmtB family transcription factor [Thermus sp.]|uniref:ArsR/SmtB family transcription factor n=1 Tax=Thermus sp. TaxID=275 RepID=UPI0025DCC35F|nr:metalloregulator ArsR/SmtB family transcription factor [Thermus sp.]MCS6868746.1 metalloregulator ArsR/SmtB family transcription factor [Thermus sp.]MCS7217666.1 metalloregulator ArsR/SmtB family transcription factor [Thermus sp.]MCX7850494.1 metalloregulator ArsR/SmtB family transcription factor [Thermus sp.]MDW8017120.1 metalloregulator ArsR/SmtB family transcription factor [Thermus sp.]MDW8358395.1 metalloregulator ArsR/SmtB family transcription factor [Thermus sp.]